MEVAFEPRSVSIHPRAYSPATRDREGQRYARRFWRDWREERPDFDDLRALVNRRVWSPCVWSQGRRAKAHFEYSEVFGLDFETPFYTLEQAIKDWCDTVCIIGVTHNHQRPKAVPGLGLVTLDRFRIIAPWATAIRELDCYEQNVAALVEKYGADVSCVDGARLFYPCREIVFENSFGYLQPVAPARRLVIPISPAARAMKAELFNGRKPAWLHKFLVEGKLPPFDKFGNSRAWACWGAGETLAALGYEYEAAVAAVEQSPFDRVGFDRDELADKVAAGFKTFRKRMKQGG